MKTLTLVIILILFCMNTFQSSSQSEITLHWKFKDPRNGQVIDLGTKGSIQEALIREGIVPDPHKEMNELQFGWIEEYDWEVESSFYLTKQQLKNSIELYFPNVDTYARVYLNGKLIIHCDNAFIPYSYIILFGAKEGFNTLKVVFTPPVLFHKNTYKNAKYKLPATNDTHPIAIAPYTRKPQYQFGWDWALRMNTIGFNKEAKVLLGDFRRVVNTSIQTLSLSNENAILKFSFKLNQSTPETFKINSRLFGVLECVLKDDWYHAEVYVKNPRLWWPKNHGEQYLYEDEWEISSEFGIVEKALKKKFGIRKAELVLQKDQYGTSYEVKINDRIIFCKGGNIIPQEIFPAKVTDEMIVQLVDQMDQANFNMVRVWGGGYYPDDIFYEECDRRGLMVWQDFMFACAMYPSDDAFLANVSREIEYQTNRISSHPSVVLFNGNNEVDIAWKNWGYQLKYNLSPKACKEIENGYKKLFQQVIPSITQSFTTVPYIHTSPLSNWGKNDNYNHGTQHYWGVWHGKDPMEDFATKIGRFNAEYGFQSFPEMSTLSNITDSSNWKLDSEVMKLRQKSYVGNGMIKKHADRLFGETDNFQRFVYLSQLTQAKAVSLAVSGHRIDFPRCTGTIYWQVNDCWPAPTWSSIDYYGNWKALHYEVKRDFENVAIVSKERKLGNKEFYIVTDWVQPYTTIVEVDVYNLDGEWDSYYSFNLPVNCQSNIKIPLDSVMDHVRDEYIYRFRWSDQKGNTLERTFYNFKSIKNLPKVKVYVSLNKLDDGKYLLCINNDSPLFSAWIYTVDKVVHLNDNFNTLLPGIHRFIFESELEVKLEDIKVMTLAN